MARIDHPPPPALIELLAVVRREVQRLDEAVRALRGEGGLTPQFQTSPSLQGQPLRDVGRPERQTDAVTVEWLREHEPLRWVDQDLEATALLLARAGIRSGVPATEPDDLVPLKQLSEGLEIVLSLTVPLTRLLTTTSPLSIEGTIGGTASLAANRTFGLAALTTLGTANQLPGTNGAATAWEYKTLAGDTGLAVVHGAGTITFDLDAGLSALATHAATGLLAATGTDAWASRTLVGPAAGLTITEAGGVAGNPTFALAHDLAGLEGLAGDGLAVRTGTDTWTLRDLVAGSAQVTVANGDGVAGNPAIDLAATLTSVARVTVRKNTGADVGSRRRLNFIEGTNITLTVADDAGAEEVDITITAAGGGGGDSITVNASAVVDADFDDATPAAPTGDLNIKWQKDGSSPANISGYVDVSDLEPLVWLSNVAILQTAVTVGTSAVALPSSALTGRKELTVENLGTVPIYVGAASVTTATGARVQSAGGAITLRLGPAVTLYGISGTAGQDVRVLESS